jgi:transposase
MEAQRRGSDGRQLFSAEFKRDQVARVLRKEITFAELSRELGIDQSVVPRWQHLVDGGSRTAVAATEDVVPASELRAAQLRVRELERALGKKAIEVEILQAAREEVKKTPRWYGVSKRRRVQDCSHLPSARYRPRDGVP